MLCGIFFQHSQKEEENMHKIFIARAGACARRKTHRIIRKKRHNGKTTPSLHLHIPEHTRSLSGSLLGYKTIP